MRRAERSVLQLPHPLLWGFLVLLASQILFHQYRQSSAASDYQPLTNPLNARVYRGIAMGSEHLMSYLLVIRLQLHDNQAGRHYSYAGIDYPLLIEWLEQITGLNPASEYPMMLASRVYSQTRDHSRLRLILGFIQRRFDDNPQLHWRRLAEATVIARHKLEDLEFALLMAEKLARQPATVVMPGWARDMRFLLLADMNELESAIAIIQALLQTAAVTDVDERRFLQEKLLDFQQKLFESQQTSEN
jgi:hypothetical protein